MKTINYQGQEIQATLVNYLSGAIPTSTVDHAGDEELFRDEEGRYYLRRRLDVLDSEGARQPASGRTFVHRINVNAAILWATTRLNSETLALRSDAANLLMDNWGYCDPHPLNMNNAWRKAEARDSSPVVTQAGTLPDEVTVPVTLPLALYRRMLAMAVYDGRDLSASIANGMEDDIQAWLESDELAEEQGKPNPASFLAQFERDLDAGRHPGVYPASAALGESLLASLNPEVKALVSRYLAETPWAYSAADVINGCVTDTLRTAFNCLEDELGGSAPEDDEQFYDGAWGYAEEHICAAYQERIGGPALESSQHGYTAFRPVGQAQRSSATADAGAADAGNTSSVLRDEPL